MTDRLPPDKRATNSGGSGEDERIRHLKKASRLIVTTREKMPHSAQWHLSLRRTLWRYTQEVLLQKSGSQPAQTKTTEEKNHGSQHQPTSQEPTRQQRDL
jgi:hypothetical protein